MERVQKIYKKTDGNCHICHGKLNFYNYGIHGSKGAWEIEHSVPKSFGGSDHLNNLFPAHITCNREKGIQSTRTVRSAYGNTRAPYSKKKKQKIKNDQTAGGALIGGGIGLVLGGPVGSVIGSVLGGLIGNGRSVKK